MQRRSMALFFLSFALACEPITKLLQKEQEAPRPIPATSTAATTQANAASAVASPTQEAATKPASQGAALDASLLTPKSDPALLQQLSKGDSSMEEFKTAPQVKPESIPKEGLPQELPSFAGVKETGYRVSYAKSKNPYFDSIREVMEQQKIFEAVTDNLNETFSLPRVVDVQLTDCGVINAFYDPKTYRLIMCYEMIGSFIEVFKPLSKTDKELFTNVFGGVFFVFLHEAGHSMVHLLGLPITGREEDAVDQLATIVLLFGGDEGVQGALAAAQRFYISGEAAIEKGLPFWDEHSLGQQRFYNIACLIYGSDPEKYAGLVTEKLLPKPRAARCPGEYATASSSWRTLLKPYIKVPEVTPTSAPELGETPPSLPSTSMPDAAASSALEETSDHVINLIMSAASKELAALSKDEASKARTELLDRVLTLSEELTNACVEKGLACVGAELHQERRLDRGGR